ncbi:MAG: ABC transporter permease [Steroidobacteraceae bacterium]|nr:ABC transporter permease [Steroidobacteraceae bacterium]
MPGRQYARRLPGALAWLRDLVVLVLGTLTLLFFLLRLAGDPAVVLAGPDATPEQIAEVRAELGLDRSLPAQYLAYVGNLLRLDFGTSLADGTPALAKVLTAYPASLLLGGLAMALTLAITIPLGAWLGAQPGGATRGGARAVLFALQGFPGFVIALLLIHVFAIELVWLPALGHSGPASWILPAVSVAMFLAPKLARMIEANVGAALSSGYVRTARAIGASEREVLWRHALPNALLGAIALVGAQFAFLVTGLVIIETIFAWPGIGWLLVQSTVNLDFPVIQAITLVVVITVFLVNSAAEWLQRRADPRTRPRAVAPAPAPEAAP